MSNTKDAIKYLGTLKGQHVVITVWSENDVLEYAQENDIKITRKQARNVIDLLDKKQDSSIGINFPRPYGRGIFDYSLWLPHTLGD